MKRKNTHKICSFLLIFASFLCYGQNSLNFDGINDYVSVPNGGGLNNLQTGTIELWVKWNGTAQDIGFNNCYGAILGRQKNYTFNNQIIGLNGANPNTAKIIWMPYSGGSETILTSTISPNNNWIHLAIVYSNGDHRMYINGVLEDSSSTTGSIVNDSNIDLSIGAWIDHGVSYANANIDEFRIWNIAKTDLEINANMNKELVGNEIGLITYFNFNQGIADGDNSTETILTDSTSNNFDGNLTNFALTGTTSNWATGVDFDSLSINENEFSHSYFFVNNNLLIVKKQDYLNKIKSIEVYNLLGQQVFKTSKIEKEITLNQLINGVYIVKVNTSNSYQTLKFLKN